jgi:hypothetical protein
MTKKKRFCIKDAVFEEGLDNTDIYYICMTFFGTDLQYQFNQTHLSNYRNAVWQCKDVFSGNLLNANASPCASNNLEVAGTLQYKTLILRVVMNVGSQNH